MNSFRQKLPRQTAIMIYQCFAKPVLFLPWDDMPKTAQREFKKNGPIPCEGGGMPGEWCLNCRFGAVEVSEEE